MKSKELFLDRKYLTKMITGKNILKDLKEHLVPLLAEKKVVFLTNSYLMRLYGDALVADLKKQDIDVRVITVVDGEKAKSIITAQKVFDSLVEEKIDRATTLITLGGGVIGDLGGYIASTFKRGIPLIHIPTTLLAQIDSSIGGKTALNHAKAKNIIGTFYPPLAVLSDPEVLQSLSIRQIKNGLVEAIKIGIIQNSDFFHWIEENMVKILQKEPSTLELLTEKAMQEKINLILRDPWEKKERHYLNLGHTVGHGWEAIFNYKDVTHGEAVALGILMETKIAGHKGLCSAECQKSIKKILDSLFEGFTEEPFVSIPMGQQTKNTVGTAKNKNTDPDKFWEILTLDKKNKEGRVVFIAPKQLGEVCIMDNVTKEDFKNAMSEFL